MLTLLLQLWSKEPFCHAPPRWILAPPSLKSGRVLVAVAALAAAMSAWSVAPAAAQGASGAFSDDDGAYYEAPFDALAERGILAGTECNTGQICPDEPIERSTMAVWLGRALTGSEPVDTGTSRFADVDARHWTAPHIKRFAELGVTLGCATEPLRYCPDGAVTRAQMAAFLVRAFELDDAPSAGFADTSGHYFETEIDKVAAARITLGCAANPPRYCPKQHVTRGQMATFIARALGLTTTPTTQTRIAFTARFGNTQALYVANADGTNTTEIADSIGWSVVWSSDGTRIAYTVPDTRGFLFVGAAYVANADGTNTTKITDTGGLVWSSDGTRVAYTVIDPDTGAIAVYVANADGTNTTKITDSGGFTWWSPDGTRIIYRDGSVPRDGSDPLYVANRALYVANADGTNTAKITDSGGFTWWSPDGTRIIYQVIDPDTGAIAVYVADADGTNTTKIGDSTFNVGWSPDGTRITYTVRNPNKTGDVLYVANADGTNTTKIADYGSRLLWSPDGTRITYQVVDPDAGAIGLYVVRALYVANADGTNTTKITDSFFELGFRCRPSGTCSTYPEAQWSPDGTRIAYGVIDPDTYADTDAIALYVADADGTNTTKITDDSGSGLEWSPDGTRIAYIDRSDPASISPVYVANADGTNTTKIADYGSRLRWSPDGTRIAYIADDESGDALYIANTDGTNAVKVAGRSQLNWSQLDWLEWSPK